jgi:hypothetical protein
MNQQQLREMIDACRPGRDDLHEPELSALADHLAQDEDARRVWEKSQRLDAALSAAFRDVPVPADLESRLLARFDNAPATKDEEIVARRRSSRRTWLATLVSGGVAAAVAAMFYLFGAAPEEISQEELIRESQEWLTALELDDPQRDDRQWRELDEASIRAFPVTQVAASPVRWRYVATDFGRKSRVYQLRVGNRQTAYLVVVPTNKQVGGAGGVPPRGSFPQATGGWRIGAWQAGGNLYVLAVEGSEALYRSLVPTRTTA